MARICMITGKSSISGNSRSHSLVATRRKWGVNLQKVKLEIDGRVRTVKISTRALRTLKKAG
ncbi:50S ribosomal protein L28 [bacterium]|jgi:large subunit ribosomal protein L28|nr:50S ribosomal protein L28 [bacterium]